MQTVNEFIAFRTMFNTDLLKAVENRNIFQVKYILNATYKFETENGFFIKDRINFDSIKKISDELEREIKNNPSLIYNL